MRLRNDHPSLRPDLTKVKRALGRLGLKGGAAVPRADVVLIDDGSIAGLAGAYRGSPRPTDVLAFAYDDEPALAGEIALSLDTARRQARERGVSLAHEITLLCIHGLLHVGGQGDETRRDWCAMRVAEFEALARAL